MIDLTPREQHVLAGSKLGLPNKLIAARLEPVGKHRKNAYSTYHAEVFRS